MRSNSILSVHSCILDVHGRGKNPQRPTELQIETLNSVLIYHDCAITRSYYTGFIINKTSLICTQYKRSNKYSLYTNAWRKTAEDKTNNALSRKWKFYSILWFN